MDSFYKAEPLEPTVRPVELAVLAGDDHLDILEETLQCPICLDFSLPPLCVCPSGHTVCERCKQKLTRRACPYCRKVFQGARNFVLEKLFNKTKFFCFFKEMGCTETPTGEQFQPHALACGFRPMVCQLRTDTLDCSRKTKGSGKDVILHLLEDHKLQEVENGGYAYHKSILQNVYLVCWKMGERRFLECYRHRWEPTNCFQYLDIVVSLLGNKKDAESFQADLTFIREGEAFCPHVPKLFETVRVRSFWGKGIWEEPLTIPWEHFSTKIAKGDASLRRWMTRVMIKGGS